MKLPIFKILSKKNLIWYFNYNIMILICQTWMKFCKQFIYFIFTHILCRFFRGVYLFFIWVYLDGIYSSSPQHKILAPRWNTIRWTLPKKQKSRIQNMSLIFCISALSITVYKSVWFFFFFFLSFFLTYQPFTSWHVNSLRKG